MKILKILSVTFFALIFLILKPSGYAATTATTTSGTKSFFGVTGDVCAFWKAIFDFAIQIAGGIALLVVAVGGVMYLVSMGDSGKQKTAKDIMSGALFGMILALTSWTLFTVLNPYLLQCKIEVPQISLCNGLECVFDNCKEKWGVDRCFSEVVAYNESGFQTGAQLKHGNVTIQYQGLYGISWSEVQSYNKANGTNYTKDQLLDPEVNGEVACWKFSQEYLNKKYYYKNNNPADIYKDDERKKYLMTYLAAGSGPAALNWMITTAKKDYNTANPTAEQLLQKQKEWGNKVITDRYNKKCFDINIGTWKSDCCDTYLAEKLYKTCNINDLVKNTEDYGNILRGAKVKMLNNYDRCKEGKSLYDPSKKY